MEDRLVVIVLTAMFVFMVGTTHVHVSDSGIALAAQTITIGGR